MITIVRFAVRPEQLEATLSSSPIWIVLYVHTLSCYHVANNVYHDSHRLARWMLTDEANAAKCGRTPPIDRPRCSNWLVYDHGCALFFSCVVCFVSLSNVCKVVAALLRYVVLFRWLQSVMWSCHPSFVVLSKFQPRATQQHTDTNTQTHASRNEPHDSIVSVPQQCTSTLKSTFTSVSYAEPHCERRSPADVFAIAAHVLVLERRMPNCAAGGHAVPQSMAIVVICAPPSFQRCHAQTSESSRLISVWLRFLCDCATVWQFITMRETAKHTRTHIYVKTREKKNTFLNGSRYVCELWLHVVSRACTSTLGAIVFFMCFVCGALKERKRRYCGHRSGKAECKSVWKNIHNHYKLIIVRQRCLWHFFHWVSHYPAAMIRGRLVWTKQHTAWRMICMRYNKT